MPRTNTIGIGAKLGLDTKEANAALKDYETKFEQHRMKMSKISAIKIKPEFQQQSVPEAARPQAEYLNKTRAMLTVNGQVVASNREMQKAMKGSGMGILEMSRAFEDAQYGMRGVLNNLPGMVMSFGGSMATAAKLSIAAVSAQMTATMWDNPYVRTGRAALFGNLFGDEDTSKEEMLKVPRERTERARGVLRDRSSAGADRNSRAMDARTTAERGGFEHYEREAAAADELASAERELAEARMEGLEGTARAEAMAAIRHEQEEASLDRRIALEQKRRELNNQSMEDSDGREAAMQAELASIKPRSTKIVGDVDGQAVVEDVYSEDDASRRKLLQQGMADEQQYRGKAGEQRDSAARAIDAAGVTRQANALREQADAARTAREGVEEAKNIIVGAFGKIGEAFAPIATTIEITARKAHDAAVKSERAANSERALGISEIRSPSRRRRAQRAADFADETKRLMEEEGLSPEAAADKAQRFQRVRDRSSGDRTIRGAGPARTTGGLDAFDFKQRGNFLDRPLPDPAAERGGAAQRRAKADADKAAAAGGNAGDPGLRMIADKLQELINIGRDSTKTPAERQQPVRRTA